MTVETDKRALLGADMRSTLTGRGLTSGANWIGSADVAVQDRFLSELDEGELVALPFLFEFWAMPHQLPPKGDWRSWVIMGGRGAGKTRAGAEWVRAQVEGARPLDAGRCRRVALVGETIEQVREGMIFGDSGILACSPADRRPDWEATRKRLVWPNGAVATVHTAHDPEGLRGPQFDAAWVDELAKWKKAEETWDTAQCRRAEKAAGVTVDRDHPCPDRGERCKSGGVIFGGSTRTVSRDAAGAAGAGWCAAGRCRRGAVDIRADRGGAGAGCALAGPDRRGAGPCHHRRRGVG